MKFKTPAILWYVCPFIFTIESVKIDYAFKEDCGTLFYIEDSGGYLKEEDLFDNLESAKEEALMRLKMFYIKKTNEIISL